MKNASIPQPSIKEIEMKLRSVIAGKETRENISDWAMNYIINDDNVEVTDYKAWHFLVDVTHTDAAISPGEYLYCNEDFEDWIREYTE